jgi:hypothetical protein
MSSPQAVGYISTIYPKPPQQQDVNARHLDVNGKAIAPANRRFPMSQQSISPSAKQPSFFYLMMARGCFDRARRAGHSKGAALRNIGHAYLIKATTFDRRLSKSSAGARVMKEAA